MGISGFNRLKEHYTNAQDYPENLNNNITHSPKRVLLAQKDRLNKDQERIFHKTKCEMEIMEARVGENKFKRSKIDSYDNLRSHLDKHLRFKQKDPRSRHVFIPAINSRKQILCTAEIFRLLCSYQQISPRFLKLMHSLGAQGDIKKFHAVGFFEEIVPNISSTEQFDVPEIGRSGFELRNYYQLQAMEISANAGYEWSMRQATIYHSFDLETARCFWMTIKADDEIKERVIDQTGHQEHLNADTYANFIDSFSASLSIHLIHLEWCSDGWRQAIDSEESRFRDILDHAQAVTLGQHDFKKHARLLSFKSHRINPETPTDLNNEKNDQRHSSSSSGDGFFGRFKKGQLRRTKSELHYEAEDAMEQIRTQAHDVLKYEDKLQEFSLEKFQDLTTYTMKLQEFKLAMTLNMEILEGIRNFYNNFLESPDCPEIMQSKCKGAVRNFSRRVRSIELELGIECRRAQALIDQLQEGKPLYDSILQFRNAEMNKLMAFNARYASLRMESVGERTETLTGSMHIITFLTLILLPGTFLGSFFSTEIIQGEGDSIKYNKELGILFAAICVPMMLVALLSWALYVKTRRRKNLVAIPEAANMV